MSIAQKKCLIYMILAVILGIVVLLRLFPGRRKKLLLAASAAAAAGYGIMAFFDVIVTLPVPQSFLHGLLAAILFSACALCLLAEEKDESKLKTVRAIIKIAIALFLFMILGGVVIITVLVFTLVKIILSPSDTRPGWEEALSTVRPEQMAEEAALLAEERMKKLQEECTALDAELIRVKTRVEENRQFSEELTALKEQSAQAERIGIKTARMAEFLDTVREKKNAGAQVSQRETAAAAINALYIRLYTEMFRKGEESGTILLSELEEAMTALLSILKAKSIPVFFFGTGEHSLRSDTALCVFEWFEALAEQSLSFLTGMNVVWADAGELSVKITLENAAFPPLPAVWEDRFRLLGMEETVHRTSQTLQYHLKLGKEETP